MISGITIMVADIVGSALDGERLLSAFAKSLAMVDAGRDWAGIHSRGTSVSCSISQRVVLHTNHHLDTHPCVAGGNLHYVACSAHGIDLKMGETPLR